MNVSLPIRSIRFSRRMDEDTCGLRLRAGTGGRWPSSCSSPATITTSVPSSAEPPASGGARGDGMRTDAEFCPPLRLPEARKRRSGAPAGFLPAGTLGEAYLTAIMREAAT